MNPSEQKAYLDDLLTSTAKQYAAGHAKEHDELAEAKPKSSADHIVDHPGDEPLPATAAGGDEWDFDRIAADPDGFFEAHKAQWAKENPGMTDAQLRANWDAARHQFGI